MTHRVGIIGLGTVGARFVEQFTLHPEFELVAAWDADPEACLEHAQDVTIAANAAEVIALADVVYIAVPPLFHRQYVQDCLTANTAIFCEKPLGIDLDESRTLVAAVETSGLPAGVNFVFSAAPSATELQASVAARNLGDVLRGDIRLHFAKWPRAWHTRAQWLTTRAQGGWIREVLSHFLFVAGRALGPLTLRTADVHFPDGPGGTLSEDSATARFDATDTPVVMIGTSGGDGPDVIDFTVRGTEGSMRIWDWYHLHRTDGGGWTDVFAADSQALASAAFAAQLDQLSLMLEGQPHGIATFREALNVQELVEDMLNISGSDVEGN
ncbi:MAG: putative dehydrogenase [Candidatus Poriferisodalaceae bacterium]|jgi:predicted dehydrogenase